MDVVDTINNALDNLAGEIAENPLASSGIALGAGAVLGTIGGVLVARKTSKRKKKSKSSKKRNKKGKGRDRRFKSKQKHEQKYKRKRKYKIYGKKGYFSDRKRKRKSSKGNKRVKYTKKGQPYIILKSGKARFIKK